MIADVNAFAAPMQAMQQRLMMPGNAMAPQTAPQTGNAFGGTDWQNAIAGIESKGSGGYAAVGPDTGKGRAYGKYQVMDFNIGPWTQKYLGRSMTPQEFLADPAAQDAVFNGEFGSYVQKYGNPQDAASAWFTGRPLAQGADAQDVNGMTGAGYVSRFSNALRG